MSVVGAKGCTDQVMGKVATLKARHTRQVLGPNQVLIEMGALRPVNEIPKNSHT